MVCSLGRFLLLSRAGSWKGASKPHSNTDSRVREHLRIEVRSVREHRSNQIWPLVGAGTPAGRWVGTQEASLGKRALAARRSRRLGKGTLKLRFLMGRGAQSSSTFQPTTLRLREKEVGHGPLGRGRPIFCAVRDPPVRRPTPPSAPRRSDFRFGVVPTQDRAMRRPIPRHRLGSVLAEPDAVAESSPHDDQIAAPSGHFEVAAPDGPPRADGIE